MSRRNRTTWRTASAAPAVPGYGSEDQSHPAHKPDPAYEAYKKGDPSAWAEDPRKGPYPEGNPPNLPGYDVEDQDHPAHVKHPRVPKLSMLVKKKARQCVHIASRLLGKNASEEDLEKKALELMDFDEDSLDSLMPSHEPEPVFDMDDDYAAVPAAPSPIFDEESLFAGDDEDPMKSLMAEVRSLRAQVNSLSRQAGKQNDYRGVALSEEEARKEKPHAKEASSKTAARKLAARMFAACDCDNDGFLMREDWAGSPAVFSAADSDEDGVVSMEDFVSAMSESDKEEPEQHYAMTRKEEGEESDADKMAFARLSTLLRKFAEEESEEDSDKKEEAKKEEAKKEEAKKEAFFRLARLIRKAAEESEEEPEEEPEEEEEEEESDKEAYARLAALLRQATEESKKEESKKEESKKEEAEDEDDGDLDFEEEPKKEAGKNEEGEEEAEDADEESEDLEKLALDFQLSASEEDSEDDMDEPKMSARERKLLASIYPVVAADDKDEEEGEEKSVEASLRPRRREASNGVRTVGNMVRTASKRNDLESLWASAPDVSEHFGVKR